MRRRPSLRAALLRGGGRPAPRRVVTFAFSAQLEDPNAMPSSDMNALIPSTLRATLALAAGFLMAGRAKADFGISLLYA